MTDITKCTNTTCTIKEFCYRWTVEPSKLWQSWGFFDQSGDGKCGYFWQDPEREYK